MSSSDRGDFYFFLSDVHDFYFLVLPIALASESEAAQTCPTVRLFETPWTVAYQAPPSMGFCRQECWSGLPFPSPGIFPAQESYPGLPHCRQTLYCLSHHGVGKDRQKQGLSWNAGRSVDWYPSLGRQSGNLVLFIFCNYYFKNIYLFGCT